MVQYYLISFLFGLVSTILSVEGKGFNIPCTWSSKTGSNYDLRPLKLSIEDTAAYRIIDGDIPCTPEEEPSYGYAWNFCANVPNELLPTPCKMMGKNGVVLQYAEYSEDDYYCFIVGHFDPSQHELTYRLLDTADPSKGVSISYPSGEKCSALHPQTLRSATIDVSCANVESVVVSAEEPSLCQYHLSMKSFYGCPTTCPVTSNGLCDSHGHCAFDKSKKESYCYCNEGYSGSSCSTVGAATTTTYDGFSVQLGLLITLLLVALGLTGGVIYTALQIAEFRKEQISNNYKSLPGSESEMVETVNFSG